MNRRALIWMGLLLALLLVGCDEGAAVTPTLAPTADLAAATTTDDGPQTTAAPLATPTAAAATPAPAATSEPTFTPGPSPTPDAAALLVAAGEPRVNAVLGLPGKPLRAEVLIYDCAVVDEAEGFARSLELLIITDSEAEVEYQIASQMIACEGLGAFGLEPLAWGASGRYFYYTTAREGGPDGACRPWVRPMTRVDLVDMTLTTLDQAAMAPEGRRVAGWVNGDLVVFARDGGELGRSAPAALPPQVGPPVWSPDGASIAYIQYTSHCGEVAGESAVVVVDTTTFQPRVLLTQSAPEFDSVEWIDNGRLALGGLMDTGRWEYDLATGTLTPVP